MPKYWFSPIVGALVVGSLATTCKGDPGGSQANLPPVPTTEPRYQAGQGTSYLEAFEGFTSTSGVLGAYANKESHGVLTLDSTSFAGNKTLEITYNNDGCLGSSDADVEIERNIGDADASARDWVVTYYNAFQAGYEFWWGANISSCPRGNASKEVIIFRDPNNTTGGRISVLANTETACPAVYGSLGTLLWNITIDQQPGNTQPTGCGSQRIKQHLALTTENPDSIADGQFHRFTIFFRKESRADAGDGAVRMWVDGVMVIDYNGADPASPAYHKTFTRLNGFAAPIQFPTVLNAGAPQQQSQWFDSVAVWHY
jgi:hypothetical protein